MIFFLLCDEDEKFSAIWSRRKREKREYKPFYE